MPTSEEIKATEQKAQQEEAAAAKAKAEADAAQNTPEVKDGKRILSEDQYNNFLKYKEDMHLYKNEKNELKNLVESMKESE